MVTRFVAESRRRLRANDHGGKNTRCIMSVSRDRSIGLGTVPNFRARETDSFSRESRPEEFLRAGPPNATRVFSPPRSVVDRGEKKSQKEEKKKKKTIETRTITPDRRERGEVDVDLRAIPREVLCVNPSEIPRLLTSAGGKQPTAFKNTSRHRETKKRRIRSLLRGRGTKRRLRR